MGASSSKDPSTAATVSGYLKLVSEEEEQEEQENKTSKSNNEEKKKKLSLVSVQCTLHKDNELKFMFYPFYPTEEDIARMEQGFNPDNHSDRPSPNSKQFSDCCPWVFISIELTEQEMVKNGVHDNGGVVGKFVPTLNVVNGLIATKATIQAQWFEKRGFSHIFTNDLPTNDFLLFQNQENKSLSLEWKGSGMGMEWDIITNPVCYVSRKPQDIFWYPDKVARTCMRCYQPFGLITRRHHCRDCGMVVCSTCSLFKNKQNERICSLCNDMDIFRVAREAEVIKAAAEVDDLLPRKTEVALHSSSHSGKKH